MVVDGDEFYYHENGQLSLKSIGMMVKKRVGIFLPQWSIKNSGCLERWIKRWKVGILYGKR